MWSCRPSKLCLCVCECTRVPVSSFTIAVLKNKFILKTNDPQHHRYAEKICGLPANLINLIILLFNNASKCKLQPSAHNHYQFARGIHTLHSKIDWTRWLFTSQCILIKYGVLIYSEFYARATLFLRFTFYIRKLRLIDSPSLHFGRK